MNFETVTSIVITAEANEILSVNMDVSMDYFMERYQVTSITLLLNPVTNEGCYKILQISNIS